MRGILILTIFFITSQAFAQLPDTVYVTTDKFVYLLFDSQITMAHLADKSNFAYNQQGDLLVLKSNKVAPEPTTLMVRTNTKINVTILAYKENLTTFLIDSRRIAIEKSEAVAEKTSEIDPEEMVRTDGLPDVVIERLKKGNRDSEIGDLMSQANMYRVLKAEPEFNNNIGNMKDNLFLFIYNIYVDEKYIYLKFRMNNTSSIAFDVDFFSFQVLQGGKIRKNEANQTTILPYVYKESVTSIHPQKYEDLIYVLDIYAFKDKDKLKVKISELEGDRSLDFNIPAKLIANAKRL